MEENRGRKPPPPPCRPRDDDDDEEKVASSRSKTVGKFARKSSRYFNFAGLALALPFPPFVFISTICVSIFDNNLVKKGARAIEGMAG